MKPLSDHSHSDPESKPGTRSVVISDADVIPLLLGILPRDRLCGKRVSGLEFLLYFNKLRSIRVLILTANTRTLTDWRITNAGIAHVSSHGGGCDIVETFYGFI